jgi:hypothetical protein
MRDSMIYFNIIIHLEKMIQAGQECPAYRVNHITDLVDRWVNSCS